MTQEVKLTYDNIVRSADSTTVSVYRTDASTIANLALPADATDDDISTAAQALGKSLANQDSLISMFAGQTFNTESGAPVIQVVTGQSNPDSLTLTYKKLSTGDVLNFAANTDSTPDSLTTDLQALADSLSGDGLIGTSITVTSDF